MTLNRGFAWVVARTKLMTPAQLRWVFIISSVLMSALLSQFGSLFHLGHLTVGYTVTGSMIAFLVSFPVLKLFGALLMDLKRVERDLAERNRLSELLERTLEAERDARRVREGFIATVSHELRTPLNSIINVPEGLLEDFSDAAIAECRACEKRFAAGAGQSCEACGGALTTVATPRFDGDPARAVAALQLLLRSGRHLLEIVDDLLLFREARHEGAAPVIAPVAAANLVEGVSNSWTAEAKRRALTLTVARRPSSMLRTDAGKLSRILDILLSNAVKFSPAGGAVTLDLWAQDADMVFSVKDTGIGIDPENFERIFEGFRQVDQSSTRKFGGVGLGLALAREYARVLGGSIWLESVKGHGSTFFVRVPRELAPEKPTVPQQLQVPALTNASAQPG